MCRRPLLFPSQGISPANQNTHDPLWVAVISSYDSRTIVK